MIIIAYEIIPQKWLQLELGFNQIKIALPRSG
jgi:hypothetical protein